MDLKKLFSHIDANKGNFINTLKKWVAVKSVSSSPLLRKDCIEMVNLVAKEMKELGCQVNIVKNPRGQQEFADGRVLDLPPIILASYGNSPNKKTLGIYGHIDVQPAHKADGWDTEPFELTIKGDLMIGRGSSDDKGPVLGWLCMLRSMKELNFEPQLNLKFIFECMEEYGSEGLDELVYSEKDGFLKNIDYMCISDNYWLGTEHPCVTYGLRGICYFSLEVTGSPVDLHSGVYGGTIYEPMTDLIKIMSKLVDNHGDILIPNIYNDVAPVTEGEADAYVNIDFDPTKYASDIQCTPDNLIYKDKVQCLMHRWRYPTLSLHGIEGAFSEQGAKTVIPSKVIGKFSIRMVPNMTVEKARAYTEEYVNSLWKELKTPNKMRLLMQLGAPAWVTDVKNHNFSAACRATKQIYGVEPDLTREGGSIPVTLTFEDAIGKSVVLLPMGRGNDGAHSQNEKLNISNFMNGIKLFAAYLNELSAN